MLKVKRIFGETIQGEGAQTGLPAIFVRFSGCNMWNGLPETRADSQCPYCDTDFHGGELLGVEDIIATVNGLSRKNKPIIVISGGEPLLQPSSDLFRLVARLRETGYQVQIETNGTVYNEAVKVASWVTVSPKQPPQKMHGVVWDKMSCFKLLYPHPFLTVEQFLPWLTQKKVLKCLQPIEASTPEETAANLKATIEKVKELGYPWRISLQTHKIMGLE